MPPRISGPEDPYAWLTFEGRWGDMAGSEFNDDVWASDPRDVVHSLSRWWDGPMSASHHC